MEDRRGIVSAVRNPLSILALSVLLVEIVVTTALRINVLTECQRSWLVVFCSLFPVIVLLFLFLVVWFRPQNLYGPLDYEDPSLFIDSVTRMKYLSKVQDIEKETKSVRDPINRRVLLRKVIDAVNLAALELEKEFGCVVDKEVRSGNLKYRYDAVVRAPEGSIGVEVYYFRDGVQPRYIHEKLMRFLDISKELPDRLVAIVSDSPLSKDVQKLISADLSNKELPVQVRFYSF